MRWAGLSKVQRSALTSWVYFFDEGPDVSDQMFHVTEDSLLEAFYTQDRKPDSNSVER